MVTNALAILAVAVIVLTVTVTLVLATVVIVVNVATLPTPKPNEFIVNRNGTNSGADKSAEVPGSKYMHHHSNL
jgi:hypothetical protein